MLPLLAIAAPFEAAHHAGEIVLALAFVTMAVAVVWNLWTRGD